MTTVTAATGVEADSNARIGQGVNALLTPASTDNEVEQFRQRFDANLTNLMIANPNSTEITAGVIALLAWFGFFSSGLFVPTKTYRDELLGATSFPEFLSHFGHFVVVLTCYTVTNLLFLTCISAYLGCMTLRWRISADPDQTLPLYAGVSPRRIYSAAVLRGFLLYLLVISGLLTLSDESSIVNTQFAQYIRIAGVVSVLGFATGYDPRLINRMLGRVEDLANQQLHPTK